jgi:hypothetical protein
MTIAGTDRTTEFVERAIWRYGRRDEAAPLRRRTISQVPRRRPDTMTDTLPDRLSSNPNSPFYNEELLARDIGVRFKGVEKNNVEE